MDSEQKAAPKASAVETVEKFLFNDFPRRGTITTKDYEKDVQQTTPEAIQKRLEGYHKICLYGLGSSVFMGVATGVLYNMQKMHSDWVHWGSICFVICLVLMLNGLSAASFPSSTPLALGTAGLGAWTAYVYMLATFHVASLKFHSHVEECVYSMILSSVVVTLHWGYSSQDPLIFLVLSKLVLWLVTLIVYGICKFLLLLLWTSVQVISALCGFISKQWKSGRESLLERNGAYRNIKRERESPDDV
ncbi:unnamed protein product [Urochloa humidicola]